MKPYNGGEMAFAVGGKLDVFEVESYMGRLRAKASVWLLDDTIAAK